MPIIKIDHIKLRRIIIIIAIFLIIIGCFFPWQIEGDFVNDITFGIQIYPSINDNGGLLLFFLSFFILILTIKPPNFIIYPQKMINIISITIIFFTIFFLSRVLYSKHIYPPGELGSPIIGIGLIGVIFGSILLLSVLIIDFLKQKI